MSKSRTGLLSLPVELIYTIHLHTLHPAFPHINRRIYTILKSAPASIHAQYLFLRHNTPSSPSLDLAGRIGKALTYPICNISVFQRLLETIPPEMNFLYPNSMRTTRNEEEVKETPTRSFPLPRRLFRSLSSPSDPSSSTELVKYLTFLYSLPPVVYSSSDDEEKKKQALHPDTNSHGGYALSKAVQAKDTPLIHFLLEHKADPGKNELAAVKLAVVQRDLSLVKLLVEGPVSATKDEEIVKETTGDDSKGHEKKKKKRRKKQKKREMKRDRVDISDEIGRDLLAVAVKAKAQDIVEWLFQEKGVVPDLKTLRGM